MKIETHNDLGQAKRLNQTVLIYLIESGELVGRGIIIGFNNDAISILNDSVGMLNFLRENVNIFVEDQLPS
jgi:hypothetical protein